MNRLAHRLALAPVALLLVGVAGLANACSSDDDPPDLAGDGDGGSVGDATRQDAQ